MNVNIGIFLLLEFLRINIKKCSCKTNLFIFKNIKNNDFMLLILNLYIFPLNNSCNCYVLKESLFLELYLCIFKYNICRKL